MPFMHVNGLKAAQNLCGIQVRTSMWLVLIVGAAKTWQEKSRGLGELCVYGEFDLKIVDCTQSKCANCFDLLHPTLRIGGLHVVSLFQPSDIRVVPTSHPRPHRICPS